MVATRKVIKEVKEIQFTHDELLKALFFMWDAFERSTLDFFLIKDTADQIISGGQLTGPHLDLGIRKLEWESGNRSIFDTFVEHEKSYVGEKDGVYEYKFGNVPIFVKVYDQNPCLDSFDIVFYANETFNTPNPYKRFKQEYA